LRPTPFAGASAPVTWDEIENGISIDDFRFDNIRQRVEKVGDLWKPVVGKKRFDLDNVFAKPKKKK
jgi:bifunctional non-homologous end joining protein LigD